MSAARARQRATAPPWSSPPERDVTSRSMIPLIRNGSAISASKYPESAFFPMASTSSERTVPSYALSRYCGFYDTPPFPRPPAVALEGESIIRLREVREPEQLRRLPLASRRPDLERDVPVPESDVLLLEISMQVHIDRPPDGMRVRHDAVRALGAVEEEDVVGEEDQHRQVVLHDDDALPRRQLADRPRDAGPLGGVQVRRGLVAQGPIPAFGHRSR